MPSGRKRQLTEPVTCSPFPPAVPPPYLDAVQRAQYLTLVDVLTKAGRLESTDPSLILLYAVNYGTLYRVTSELRSASLTVTQPNGRVVAHPLLCVQHTLTQKLRQCIADMGLSPVSAGMVEQRPHVSGAAEKWEGLLG